ncbi:MAG: hypothetical protein AAF802_26015, partial [Planctomycetota bacterium]
PRVIRQAPLPSDSGAWWKSATLSARNSSGLSLSAALLNRLESEDLTLVIQRNQIVVTSIETAEDICPIRIYDVTPLLPADGEYDGSIEDFIELHVVPDTWEALGGNSTMSVRTIRDRTWLIVATPTTVHWKVQALLNRLNR